MGAMIYPVVLTVIGGGLVVVALLIFVVPKFKDLFANCAHAANFRGSPSFC